MQTLWIWMQALGNLIVLIAACLYLHRRWTEAKLSRDSAVALRLGAGSDSREKKPSAFPYLFK